MNKYRKQFLNEVHNDFKGVYKHLCELEKDGYINIKQHDTYPNLKLFNYTDLCTFERKWDYYTLNCRGLVLDTDKQEIVALPFLKFFNYNEFDSELCKPQNDNYEVYEKVDGSLGIGFWYNDKVMWATRGSFTSTQAIKAQEMWDKEERDYCGYGSTLLAEIVYPENRIIIDYGKYEGLKLLQQIDNKTGNECSYERLLELRDYTNIDIANKEEINSIEQLIENINKYKGTEREGYVLKFKDCTRLKIKNKEYLNINRLVFGISDRSLTENWRDGKAEDYLSLIPEEFTESIKEKFQLLDSALLYWKLEVASAVRFINHFHIERKNVQKELRTMFDPITINCVFEHFKWQETCNTVYTYPLQDAVNKLLREHIYRNYREYIKGE